MQGLRSARPVWNSSRRKNASIYVADIELKPPRAGVFSSFDLQLEFHTMIATPMLPKTPSSHRAFGIAGSILVLLAAFCFDYLTAWSVSATLPYLFAVALAAWFVGPVTGIIFTVSATVGSTLLSIIQSEPLPTLLWNGGVKFGIFLAFCVLIDHVRVSRTGSIAFGKMLKAAACGLAVAGAASAIGFAARKHHQLTINSTVPALLASDESPLGASVTAHPDIRLATTTVTTAPTTAPITSLTAMADVLKSSLNASRPVLLGSRDPNGPSCVTVVLTGQTVGKVPDNSGDWDGGPGTKLATIFILDRQNIDSAAADFNWHQTRFRTVLKNQDISNQPALDAAEDFEIRASAFSEAARQWTSIPAELDATEFEARDNWPSLCLASLNSAVKAHDLAGVQHWSQELATAAASLRDLHRWLKFLGENEVAALDFQAKCAPLFTNSDVAAVKYDRQSTLSNFPGGLLSLHGGANYYEVERQAEGLFKAPPSEWADSKFDPTSNAGWVLPAIRDSYLKMESMLSEKNLQTWRKAARLPYERTYIFDMLDRARQSGATDQLAESLHRFNAAHSEATVGELMGELMYRGHSFAGLEWADRFQPVLLKAALDIHGSDLEAFNQAVTWTNNFYKEPDSVYGLTFTLRDALDYKKLDCVRSTDMIASLLRNSGHTRFGHIRWCAGTAGHSVAAFMGRSNDKPDIVIGDGLNPSSTVEHWPSAYFTEHAWPAGMEKNPNPYAVELYLRGLDNYIWSEGYIISGPNAGELVKTGIPYSTYRQQSADEKIFSGPYPPETLK